MSLVNVTDFIYLHFIKILNTLYLVSWNNFVVYLSQTLLVKFKKPHKVSEKLIKPKKFFGKISIKSAWNSAAFK